MKLRLFEIEYGANNPEQTQAFFQDVLGLVTKLDEPQLKVMDAGIPGLDFNCSTHIAPPAVTTSFLTDDLQEVMQRLTAANTEFTGPVTAHLGLLCVTFTNPDGYLIKVNMPTENSPAWLRVD